MVRGGGGKLSKTVLMLKNLSAAMARETVEYQSVIIRNQ